MKSPTVPCRQATKGGADADCLPRLIRLKRPCEVRRQRLRLRPLNPGIFTLASRHTAAKAAFAGMRQR